MLPQHSHMSDVYSINPADTRLTGEILEFVKTGKQRRFTRLVWQTNQPNEARNGSVSASANARSSAASPPRTCFLTT
jgi:hypothetical protein